MIKLPKEEIKIIIGASSQEYEGWIKTQREELDLLKESNWFEIFGNRKIKNILAEHVFEHLSIEETKSCAKMLYKYLSDDGLIRIAVPDGNFKNQWYQDMVKVGGPGPKDHPAYSHKTVFTYDTLKNAFEEANYKVELLEYCDENGNFHYNKWDEKEGFIYRSKRFDHRNQDGNLGFISLIVDIKKK